MKIKDIKSGRFVGEKLNKMCLVCKKLYPVKRVNLDRAKYCTKACFYISKIGVKQSQNTKIKRSISSTGKKRTRQFRDFLANLHTGSGNPKWKGGITKGRTLVINKAKYREWRNEVYKRDNYTCVICGDNKSAINADHIVPWWKDENLRLDLDNGQTLCIYCHGKKTSIENSEHWVNQHSSSVNPYYPKLI